MVLPMHRTLCAVGSAATAYFLKSIVLSFCFLYFFSDWILFSSLSRKSLLFSWKFALLDRMILLIWLIMISINCNYRQIRIYLLYNLNSYAVNYSLFNNIFTDIHVLVHPVLMSSVWFKHTKLSSRIQNMYVAVGGILVEYCNMLIHQNW